MAAVKTEYAMHWVAIEGTHESLFIVAIGKRPVPSPYEEDEPDIRSAIKNAWHNILNSDCGSSPLRVVRLPIVGTKTYDPSAIPETTCGIRFEKIDGMVFDFIDGPAGIDRVLGGLIRSS